MKEFNKDKLAFLKFFLITFILFGIAFVVTRLLHPLVVWILGTFLSFVPLSFLAVPFIFPFGIDVIFWIPLLVLVYKALVRLMKLNDAGRKIALVIFTSCLLVILTSVGLYRNNLSRGKEYFEEKYNTYISDREAMVGTQSAQITYVDAVPVYSAYGNLDSIVATLRVNPEKTGEYRLYGGLYAKDVFNFETADNDLTISGNGDFNYNEMDEYGEVQLVFKYNELRANSYTGPFSFKVNGLLLINVDLRGMFGGGTENTAHVNFVDPGTFTIGPFPLIKN